MSAAPPSDMSKRTLTAGILLLGAFVCTPVGVYRAFEDGGINDPVTFVFFLLACLTATAPLLYAWARLGSWRRWMVIALDLPFILLILVQVWRLAKRAV